MVILDPTPDSHRMYSTFPQPSSFAHSRKGSYPGPPLTLAGVGATGGGLGGQTMLGGGGFSHRRSGSDISLPGGMGAVGTGLIELGGGYDLGEHAQWGASDFFPSNHAAPALQLGAIPAQASVLLQNGSTHEPSYAHLTRQDQLLFSDHSSASSGSPASLSSFHHHPASSSSRGHHSRHSSLSSTASSSHSRSGSLPNKNIGQMMIEPDASTSFSGAHNSYLNYTPSSVQVDHSYVEGGAEPENGTLPPSAMNFSANVDPMSAPPVPSHTEADSPASISSGGGGGGTSTRSRNQLRQRAGSVRGGSRSRTGSVSGGSDGPEAMVPAALAKEGEIQRASGKEADKDKAKMAFSEFWLKTSYTPLEKATVSRQALFHSYNITCENLGLKAVNSASFGKAVRSAFLGIQTRRLGVRGNSKYHYCGIRPNTLYEVKNLATFGDGPGGTHWNLPSATMGFDGDDMHDSPPSDADEYDGFISEEEAARLDDEDGRSENDDLRRESSSESLLGSDIKRSQSMADMRTPSQNNFDDLKTPTALFHPDVASSHASSGLGPTHNFGGPSHSKQSTPPLVNAPPPARSSNSSGMKSRARSHTTTSYGLHQPIDRPSVVSLPNYPALSEAGPLPAHTIPGRAARSVWIKFNIHLDSMLDSVRALRFDQFEQQLRSFWHLPDDEREVCHAPSMAGIMSRAETIVFDAILEHFKSQSLRPISPAAVNTLRSLSLNMEQILVSSLTGYGSSFVEPRVELGARFGHLLQRFLDIHQISLALATLLSKDNSLLQIINSFEAINFESVRNHVALVCNCRPEQLVQILEVDLRQVLKTIAYQSGQYDLHSPMRPTSPEQALSTGMRAVQHLMEWVDSTAERLLSGQPGETDGMAKTASPRGILIRWSFVTSEIMRDLTIRSDPSFGSFQILKIAFDEWLSFKILRMVALSTTSVAASVETTSASSTTSHPSLLPIQPAAAQNFFALSPLVEDAFSQHPPTYNPAPPPQTMQAQFQQNFTFPNPTLQPAYQIQNQQISLSTLAEPPIQYGGGLPPAPPQQSDLWRRRGAGAGGSGNRSRSSSTASSAYDPTQGGYQQPPRPSQFRSLSYSSDTGSGVGAGGSVNAGAPSMFFSQAPSPGEELGDLGRLVEGSHLGGGMDGVDESSAGW